MKQNEKKIIGYALTGLQVGVVILWAVASTGIGSKGLNLMIINILPIPSIVDVILFGIMALLIIGLQKIKAKLGVGENFK